LVIRVCIKEARLVVCVCVCATYLCIYLNSTRTQLMVTRGWLLLLGHWIKT